MYRWAILAVFITELPILVLSHGFAGTGPITSAVLMTGTVSVLLASGNFAGFRISIADWLFVGLAGVIAASSLRGTADLRENVLMMLTLFAYPAGRLFGEKIPQLAFIWTVSLVATIGTGITLYFLILQYGEMHGKPLLFGVFDAGPTQILTTVCFVAFALISADRKPHAVWIVGLSLCAAIFAASQVRFTFVAFVFALVMGSSQIRKPHLVGSVVILLLAVIAGLLARPAMSMAFFSQLDLSPVCGGDNSISIRLQLIREAISLIPAAGPFGFGLNGFMAHSCLPGNEIHNSFLQVIVEFGWLGGALYGTLIAVALACRPTPFALYGLLFALAESMAYGRFSRDSLLLFFLGYAVRCGQSSVPVLETKLLATSSKV